MTERILVLDDDAIIRDAVATRLERAGYILDVCSNVAEARAAIAKQLPDAALLDIKLPDGEGTEILGLLAEEEGVPCIMMTAHATVESAVHALRQGAEDFLEKPFSLDRLESRLKGALERSQLRRQVRHLRSQNPLAGKLVGESQAIEEVLGLVRRIATTDTSTVLILGETGVGKGMVVRAIHDMSPRAPGPFIQVTCSALAETLMESELFGHERGAFTDARTQKRGLVEIANRGTLFLDEIGELSLNVQGKLLRFIEDRAFRRVGGTEDLRVDTRIIAATNRDLAREVQEDRFREDLYYRLRVLPIEVPPLRHRRSDIPLLAAFFVQQFNTEFGRSVREIDDEVMEILKGHDWPGNVRELRNVIERAVLLTDSERLEVESLPPELRGDRDSARPQFDLGPEGVDLEEMERALVEEALRRTDGNQTEAGRLLGLSRHQVRNRLLKYEDEE